jgi:SsrA-binding protein
MAKKKRQSDNTIQNRRARYDYELGDSLVVGIELSGRETKALRMSQGSLKGAYVTVKNDELYLLNALVGEVPGIQLSPDEKVRTRKLLAKRREIDSLIVAKQQGRTIVPLEILTSGRFIKLRISVGKGKKTFDKRQTIKKREEDRQAQAAMKHVS